jgi:hypothetical protein
LSGFQRLVSGSHKQLKMDLAAVGMPPQRHYESRSTFRNLVLLVRPDLKFPLDLIICPKPGRGSDAYTRLNMQWEKMCEAVTAIDSAAWCWAPAVTSDGATVRVT